MGRVDGISSPFSPLTRENIREHPLLVVAALILAIIAIIFLCWLTISTEQPMASATAGPTLPIRPAVVSSPPQLPSPTNPTNLSIPAISVSASVENVGLTKAGGMVVPSNTNNVGWFSLGYRPGEVGNAVLTGHVDTIWLQPAVFAHLDQLKVGDEISVTDENSNKFTFKVRKIAQYNVNELPLSSIYGTSPVPQLNLITCSGQWSWKIATYSQRTVIYSSLE